MRLVTLVHGAAEEAGKQVNKRFHLRPLQSLWQCPGGKQCTFCCSQWLCAKACVHNTCKRLKRFNKTNKGQGGCKGLHCYFTERQLVGDKLHVRVTNGFISHYPLPAVSEHIKTFGCSNCEKGSIFKLIFVIFSLPQKLLISAPSLQCNLWSNCLTQGTVNQQRRK